MSGKVCGTLIAGALFAGYVILLLIVGSLVSCIGFCDPDTCWCLAVGKWVSAHHALPATDPFSSNMYTYVLDRVGAPLIQHEWLSNVISYQMFELGGLKGLLLYTAILAVVTFVVMPGIWLAQANVPRALALVLLCLVLSAAAFRFWVRPEQFLYLSLALLMLLNESVPSIKNKKELLLLCAAIFLTMMLAANCHGMFILGVAYVFAYTIGECVQSWLSEKRWPDTLKIRLCVCLAAVLGSLCTPWPLGLWSWIFKVSRSPVQKMIGDNGPITLSDFSNPTIYPLLLLFVIVVVIFVQKHRQDSFLKGELMPLGLAFGALYLALAYRRLAPVACLFILIAISKLYRLPQTTNQPHPESIRGGIENMLANLGVPGNLKFNIVSTVLVAGSCFLSSSFLFAPTMPSASKHFRPPVKAIAYLKQQHPEGRMLNDSQFGSMMCWDMENGPDIFMDGRHDLFGPEKLGEFQNMRLCKDNWQDLMQKYEIRWIFFPPDAPIVNALQSDPHWRTYYRDDEAVVLVRQ